MQAIFKGQQPGAPEDVSMEPQDVSHEQQAAEIVDPGKQRRMNEEDDILKESLRRAENNLHSDPALREKELFILNHIRQLRIGDLLKRVDSLLALNEEISAISAQAEGGVASPEQVTQ